MAKKSNFEYWVAIVYLIAGALWIFFSDKLLEIFISDEIIGRYQTIKGLFFIVVTAFLLFLFIRKNRKIITEQNTALEQHNQELRTSEEEIQATNEELIATSDALRMNYAELEEVNAELEKSKIELKHSYEMLNYIIEHSNGGVAVHDRKLNYVYVSQKYKEQYGVKDVHILGKHHYEVFPDLPQKWRDVHQRALKGEIISADDDLYEREDGSKVYTRWECRPWYKSEDEIGGIIVYTEVINSWKQAQFDLEAAKEKAEENEMKYRYLFENNPQSMWIYDLETLGFLEVNNSALASYGYSKAEFLNMTLKDIRPAEQVAALLHDVNQNRSRHNHSGVWKHKKKSGELIDVEIHSYLIDYDGHKARLVLASDITNRKIWEREVKKLKMAVESAKTSIVIADRSGSIVYANPYFTEISGYQPDEYLGKTMQIVQSGKTSIEKYQELWQTIVDGHTWEGEMYNRSKNGKFIWVHTLISPVKNLRGGIENFVAIQTDITQQKHVAKELRKAKERAEESDRLKSAFLKNMSHEVRTPLNAIVGFTRIMANSDLGQEKRNAFAEIISKSSNKLVEIITDVVEISQLQAGQLRTNIEKFDLKMLTSDIDNQYQSVAAEKNIHFKIKDSSNGQKITTDPDKLKRIVSHLIDNALKFTLEGKVEMHCQLSDNQFIVKINDTGIGIAPEMQDIIFEPFRQVEVGTSRTFGGNGLGLAIVKAYTELLGGTICVKSEHGKGSTFEIMIPQNADEAIKKPEPEKGKRQVKNILIAEDERGNFEYLKELLSGFNVTISHAVNGKEAVEICQQNKNIDLILMDIKMPVMDGLSATRAIRKFRPNIPIIAQTAYALESEKSQFGSDFDDYIAKPIEAEKLKKVLANFVFG